MKVVYKTDLKGKKEMKALCEKFMKSIVAGKYDEAINLIRPYFPIPSAALEKINRQIKDQIPNVKNSYGRLLGYGFIREDDARLFVRYTFIQKYEISALRWVFIFYKPEKSWIVNSIRFDEKPQMIF